MKRYARSIGSMAIHAAIVACIVHCSSGDSNVDAPPARDDVDAASSARDASLGADASAEAAVADAAEGDAAMDAHTTLDARADGADAADASPPAPPYAPCPGAGAPCIIMPIGDSITFGYNSSTGGGYRLRLLHDIWNAGHDATFVGDDSSGPATLDGRAFPKSNEGYSGYTIDDAPAIHRTGISPLVPGALTKYHPHIVLLMIGTNDVGTNNDLAHAPARLAALLDGILSARPDALLVVAQITPPGDDASDARAVTYNAAIPGLVTSRASAGKHIILVDMFHAIASHPSYRTALMNGLHPNDAGYDVLGDAWYSALASHL